MMDAFEIGRWMGRADRDVSALQQAVKAMQIEITRLWCAMALVAIYSTSIAGLVNRDMLSDVLASAFQKALGL